MSYVQYDSFFPLNLFVFHALRNSQEFKACEMHMLVTSLAILQGSNHIYLILYLKQIVKENEEPVEFLRLLSLL